MKLTSLITGVMTLSALTTPALAGSEVESWWVNSAKKDCVGVAPMTCLEIQKNDAIDPEGWELFYSQIKGFDYQPGYLYRISVSISDREPPLPADVSSKVYELVEVISKEPDPALRLTNIWKVETVGGDITDPKNRRGEPLIFEFNASMRRYHGDMGCNRVQGSIARNDGENLELGAGMATMMNCDDMSVEQAVGAALSTARRYEIDHRTLRFFDGEGNEVMTFLAGD